MPITVTASAGVLDAPAQAAVLPRLSEALLARHGLAGNAFMAPNVVGSVHVLPEAAIFAGGRAQRAVFVELKVPSVTFTEQAQRQGFVDDVHRILDELTGGRYPKAQTFVNIVYAVDGSWGIGERAYTNNELGAAIGAAQAAAV